ncbi:gfo/Idh/MocA family oxidoreductase [Candidatus Parcubacteria bacterium]|jgi:predicted dehydrogenase|nr:MAG: gfo/Idh/MocA family oxidoreductase [Candidatus Parcubacteria bacterium]
MDNKVIKVGIVGCGLIGKKRAAVIKNDRHSKFICTADVAVGTAKDLNPQSYYANWADMLATEELDAVVVATPNRFLKEIALAAIQKGIHVLCEKPLGRNVLESAEMVEAAKQHGVILKTGFNHRHHPAIWKAHELVVSGGIGPIYFIRCIYGHGGRPGYEKEWRASKDICGGGELLDQGVHVVDLFRWFLGDFEEAFGYTPTYFWKMDVEDNAFAVFKTAAGQIASMHTCWTQWKNRFTFEIFGEAGYLIIEGLGGSYGPEKLTVGKRPKKDREYIGGIPDEEVIIFDGPDMSWDLEWKEFVQAIQESREPLGSGRDGLEANRLLAAVYCSAKEHRHVKISEV